MRACVPCLLSGLYQLFDLCLIKHVLTVWLLTSKSTCLVTKQCLMVFGRQIFPVRAWTNAKCLFVKEFICSTRSDKFLLSSRGKIKKKPQLFGVRSAVDSNVEPN